VSTTTADIDAYASRVRVALSDLPAAEREDLVADLEDHLAEVAAEGDLVELLGTPEAYTAELRSSAGLPPRPGPAPRERPAWLDGTLGFLPELLPGWWVLRGLVLGAVLGLLLGSTLLAVLFALVAVPASVVLGRRGATDTALHWLGVALSVAAAGALVLALGFAGGSTSYEPQRSVPAPWPSDDRTTGLSGVTNLYPYSSDGKPLQGVQLYDQNGEPVELMADTDADGRPITRAPRRTADGLVTTNVYPQEQTVADVGPGGVTARQRPVVPPTVVPPSIGPR